MARAICLGITKSSLVSEDSITIYDKNKSQFDNFSDKIKKAENISEAIKVSKYIFVCVKPQNIKDLFDEIDADLLKNKIIITICAGITIKTYENRFGDIKVIRAMPNTPLLIGYGVCALCKNSNVLPHEFGFVKSIFESSGCVTELDEDKIDAITAVTSSSPAYVYLFIKAMYEGAKKIGIDKEDTISLICKTLIGSANMVLQSEKDIDELIRMVKSPNGTTEKALDVFENSDFIKIVSDAMTACKERATELSKLN